MALQLLFYLINRPKLKEDVDESVSKSIENLDLSSKEFDKKIELVFVILNDFLKDEYKINATLLPEILDLWNPERTNYAALKIRAFDTGGQALPYVSKRITELMTIKEPDNNTLAIIQNLQETKDHLEKITNS
ncbi:MAG: hypothetical protein JEZ14_07495 [Marinilabiliaceae bacterium]|nr:hypothetical protein [Marinilabiliaceae bacterium]